MDIFISGILELASRLLLVVSAQPSSSCVQTAFLLFCFFAAHPLCCCRLSPGTRGSRVSPCAVHGRAGKRGPRCVGQPPDRRGEGGRPDLLRGAWPRGACFSLLCVLYLPSEQTFRAKMRPGHTVCRLYTVSQTSLALRFSQSFVMSKLFVREAICATAVYTRRSSTPHNDKMLPVNRARSCPRCSPPTPSLFPVPTPSSPLRGIREQRTRHPPLLIEFMPPPSSPV